MYHVWVGNIDVSILSVKKVLGLMIAHVKIRSG
jgi:hypothetical protein